MVSKNFVQVAKDVFSNRNILVIAITTSLISVTDMGWRPFWGLYLKEELGADMVAVGLLSTIASSERLLFQLPGGIMADKFGRRRIIVLGTALRLLLPILYLLARYWTHVIPALLISGAASIYMPAFNAIIADSMPENQRGAGFGAYRTITSLPQVFSPVIGGYLMDLFGYMMGFRIFMIISFLTTIGVTYARWKVLRETLDIDEEPSVKEIKTLGQTLRDSVSIPKNVYAMVAVSIFGAIGMRIVWDFMNIYAHEIVGLTNTEIGVLQTVSGIISVLLAMPGGMLSDRFGRKPMILISRIISPISIILITVVTNFPQYFMVNVLSSIGNSLGGGGMYVGGAAWNALVADLVPREKRGTVMGAMGTLSGAIATPASYVGGYLWNQYAPQVPFYISFIAGVIGSIIFFFGVKEPEKKEV
jgi:MFS family permease